MTAQATVSAADGETIILGGLITKSNQEIHRKVPVLGNVPVLKNLFRFDSVITRRTELLIILTPRVIRSREDSERLKQTEMARMHWCAADVYDIQGDINYMLDPVMIMPDEAKTEIIYPDQQPRGLEMPGASSRRDQEWLQPVPPPSTDGSELVPPQSGEGASAIGTGVGFRTLPGETYDPRQVRRADWSDEIARGSYPVRQAVGGSWPNESSNPPYPLSSPESRADRTFDPRARFEPQRPPGAAR